MGRHGRRWHAGNPVISPDFLLYRGIVLVRHPDAVAGPSCGSCIQPYIVKMLPISPGAIAETLTELWSPRVVAEFEDSFIKVAKVKGTLAWHRHELEDELFFVLKGELRIEMEQATVSLKAGDAYVVAKGVLHNPVADEECLIMLIEKKSTLHTGTVVTTKTRSIDEQMRPV